ncbi:MAG: beta-lactamase family protein [Treponema sp.]|nr:beta-lactamase family protein [Treponema sp.]
MKNTQKSFKIVIWLVVSVFICFSLGSCNAEPTTEPIGEEVFDDFYNRLRGTIEQFGISSASVAVVHDDRLVYTKHFGESIDNDSLFRIASVSKLITQVAIFWLIDQGEIYLDEQVFGENGILDFDFGTPGRYVNQVTVKHLLEYGSGLGSGLGFPSIQDRTQRDLTNPPGTNFSYNNLDYQILGRIIEKVSERNGEGLTYEDFLLKHILSPLGIKNMMVHSQSSDASAGWSASAADLARLLVRINNNPTKEDILSPAAFTFTPTPLAITQNGQNLPPFASTTWQSRGSTQAVVYKVNEKTGLVLLINQGSNIGNTFFIRAGFLGNDLRRITQWPSNDLFQEP